MNTPNTLTKSECSHRVRAETGGGGGERLASWSWTPASGCPPEHNAHTQERGLGGFECSVREEAAPFLNCYSSETGG